MTDLKDYTVQELQAELERRELAPSAKPALRYCFQWDFSKIREAATAVSDADPEDCGDEEMTLIETVMKEVYGPGFYDWWNSQRS